MYYVIEQRTCETCGGKGEVIPEEPFCNRCGRAYTHAELNVLDDAMSRTMPCGHAWRHLVESHPCPECESRGIIRREVPLTEALAALGLVVDEALCK
jgi:RecJ-like exonuclease